MNIIYGSLKVFEDENPQISQKIRADEMARMLEPYDVESIEELIQNVRNKTIDEYDNFIAKNKGTIDYTTNRPCVKIDGLRMFAKESFMEQ